MLRRAFPNGGDGWDRTGRCSRKLECHGLTSRDSIHWDTWVQQGEKFTILMFGFNLGQLLTEDYIPFRDSSSLFGKYLKNILIMQRWAFDSSEWEGRDKRVKLLCASKRDATGLPSQGPRKRGPCSSAVNQGWGQMTMGFSAGLFRAHLFLSPRYSQRLQKKWKKSVVFFIRKYGFCC